MAPEDPAPPAGYAFEAALHALPAAARPHGMHLDAHGAWPTLAVPRAALAEPFGVPFDEALRRLGELPGLFAEPDGSFVWAGTTGSLPWQVDGSMLERAGRVLVVDLRGGCDARAFDRLLAAFGWPGAPLMFQLVRPAVFLGEPAFRRHAGLRWSAGDAQTLRPG